MISMMVIMVILMIMMNILECKNTEWAETFEIGSFVKRMLFTVFSRPKKGSWESRPESHVLKVTSSKLRPQSCVLNVACPQSRIVVRAIWGGQGMPLALFPLLNGHSKCHQAPNLPLPLHPAQSLQTMHNLVSLFDLSFGRCPNM